MKVAALTVAGILILVFVFGMLYLINIFKKAGKEGKKNLTESEAVQEALELYQNKKASGMQFNSQCLGVVGDYAVDIVHVPRSEEDNLPENQCKEYREGKVPRFIELDKEGNIFRIV